MIPLLLTDQKAEKYIYSLDFHIHFHEIYDVKISRQFHHH